MKRFCAKKKSRSDPKWDVARNGRRSKMVDGRKWARIMIQNGKAKRLLVSTQDARSMKQIAGRTVHRR